MRGPRLVASESLGTVVICPAVLLVRSAPQDDLLSHINMRTLIFGDDTLVPITINCAIS